VTLLLSTACGYDCQGWPGIREAVESARLDGLEWSCMGNLAEGQDLSW
jgi:hypothetical protein